MKLYIEGFRGSYGWVNDYERKSNFEITSVDDADVIFQCDPVNWKNNEKYLGKKIVVANTLDFAEWVGGNQNTEDYVEKFVKKSNVATAISERVVGQLEDRGVSATLFYYPSQVDNATIKFVADIPKKRRLISFCRLADPGKKIEYAVRSFMDSDMPNEGWQYSLVGMEHPNFKLGNRVSFLGHLDRRSLFALVAASYYTVMPSDGEGLGLPAIESVLVGTHPIIKTVQPQMGIIGANGYYFDDDLCQTFNNLTHSYTSVPHSPEQRQELSPWIRENAYQTFESLINEAWRKYNG